MPCWQLPLEESGTVAPAAPFPLYLGVIPSNPADVYAALLATRPQALGPGAYAVLGQGLGTTEPLFTLIVNGEPAVTLGTYNSLFHVLFMFLKVPPLVAYPWLSPQARARARVNSTLHFCSRRLDKVRLPLRTLPWLSQPRGSGN